MGFLRDVVNTFTSPWALLFPPAYIAAWSIKSFLPPDVKMPGSPAPELQLTQNEIGALIPDFLGTAKMAGNLLFYGNEYYIKRGSKEKRRYWYLMTWGLGFSMGAVDTLYTIFLDEKVLWSGVLDKPGSGGKQTITGLNGFTTSGYHSGSIDIYFGTNDQVADASIGTMNGSATLNSPYRGLFYMVFKNCIIGVDSKRQPNITVVARKSPVYAFSDKETVGVYDYNPMHAIWHMMTTLVGLPSTWLDTTDFAATAAVVGIDEYTWTEKQPVDDADHRWSKIKISSSGQYMIVVADDGNLTNENGRVYTSNDYGNTWTERQPAGNDNKMWRAAGVNSSGQYMIVANYTGRLYTSSDYGITWIERQPAGNVNDGWLNVAVDGTGQYMASSDNSKLYGSDDYGITWTERQPALTYWTISIDSDGSFWIIGAAGGSGLYTSSDYGNTWTERQPAGTAQSWDSVACDSDGSFLVVCRNNGRVYTSNDYGVSWTERQPMGNINVAWCDCSCSSTGQFILLSSTSRVYYSVDYGVTWELILTLSVNDISVDISASGAAGAVCGNKERVYVLIPTGLGISMLLGNQESAISYIQTVLQHIDCILRFESDGKFHPKLIRNDYDTGTLPLINEDTLLEPPVFKRKHWIDTLNEIKVQYSLLDRNADVIDLRQSTADPVAVDMGNYGVQGRTVSKTIQYALFTTNKNATWAARKDLQKSSYPLAIFSSKVNRNLFQLQPGDCFKFSYAPNGISNKICRTLNVSEEEFESEDITIEAMEDIFSIASAITEYTDPTTPSVVLPDYTIVYYTYQKVMETPYDLIADPAIIEVIPIACPTSTLDQGFEFDISNDGGASYAMIDDMENLVPCGLLVGEYPATTLTIDDEYGFTIDFEYGAFQITSCSFSQALSGAMNVALLGSEIIFFQNITLISDTQYKIDTVIRGRMDTIKQAHANNTVFYFLGSTTESVTNSGLITGVSRDFKLIPYNDLFYGTVADATNINLALTGRAQTPYTPVNLTANGEALLPEYAGDIVLAWSPRKRGAGAGTGIPGTILPDGTHEGYFEVEIWVSGTLKRTTTAINADTWTYTSSMNTTDNGSLASSVTCKVRNYQTVDGVTYESDQAEIICILE